MNNTRILENQNVRRPFLGAGESLPLLNLKT
jgi:hypothetical protein